MMRVAIITGATGGLGTEFTRVVNSYDNVDSIWAVGRNREKLNKLESSYEEMGIKSVEEFCNLNCTVPAELISAVCPGWIDTDMLPEEKNGKKIKYAGIISAKEVVEKALADNRKGKDISTPGWFSKCFRFYSKIAPTRLVMNQWIRIIQKYI